MTEDEISHMEYMYWKNKNHAAEAEASYWQTRLKMLENGDDRAI